ncbi:hypothetical protein Calab_3157 [Caldithrix abyssi DSM 13497]|uniref:CRISPR type III-associated protein, TIGR04423 family n=1 Tax=Caldithrix abyssi DSM 13497 TaxID=880073 RepID=H1XUD7_CALAY|nr:TIGR04423 family type III CRISPR-associated protein [Caldithrix abyssi]APF18785.1 CRISPR type III-associated protein, TIGR04423 family [Caldithrix abyssi DSM 13497]EHO42763.1 hypothetical protein Calab_3157 [Caldithrix abyssi DSM 13497]
MTWHKKLNNLSEIPDLNFEGYLWLSNEAAPRRINKINAAEYEKDGQPLNPFIREAYLYDVDNNVSVAVRHVPGRYLINFFDLKKLPEDFEITEQKFLANKKIGKKLIFKEIWAPESDDNCEGFAVLRKKVTVFCGIEI